MSNKNHPWNMVKEFHIKFNHPVRKHVITLEDVANLPDGWARNVEINLIKLRCALIEEEFEEFKLAIDEGNTTEALDALGDMIYVIYGMAIALGWPLNAAIKEIHKSNMSKLGEDGKPIVRKDGKILKGPYYKEPDIDKILAHAFAHRINLDDI